RRQARHPAADDDGVPRLGPLRAGVERWLVYRTGAQRRQTTDQCSTSVRAFATLAQRFFPALRILPRGAARLLNGLLPPIVIFLAALDRTVPRRPPPLPGFVLGSGGIVPQHAAQFRAGLRRKQQSQACADERARDKSGPSHGIVLVILIIAVPHTC